MFKTFIEIQFMIIHFPLSVNVLRRDHVATMSTSYTDQFPKVLLTSYRFNNIIFHSDTYYIFRGLHILIPFRQCRIVGIIFSETLASRLAAKAAKSALREYCFIQNQISFGITVAGTNYIT